MPNLDAIFFPKGTPAVREKNEAATPFQGLQGHLNSPIRLRIYGGFRIVKFDFGEIKLNFKRPVFCDSREGGCKKGPASPLKFCCSGGGIIFAGRFICAQHRNTTAGAAGNFQFSADELLRWGNFRFPLSRRDCRFAQCAVAAPAFCCKTNLLESAVKEM